MALLPHSVASAKYNCDKNKCKQNRKNKHGQSFLQRAVVLFAVRLPQNEKFF
jgi:hypothetical protein